MNDFLTFMGPPTAACFLLAIIFTYFGCHVLKREIIFIDLSLAQLAALGTTLAFTQEIEPDSPSSLALSFLFVVAGSAFFSCTRNLSKSIPQEAVIGIVYVVSASVALLLLSQVSHGAEHLKALLNGSILWVSWGGVLKIFGITLLVGALHWKKRKQFIEQSTTYRKRIKENPRDGFLDFLFFLTLGLVIVVSVKTAGVFLIFTLLIIPAVCGALFSHSMVKQFIFGSVLGIVISLTGLLLSFFLDLPTGATLVVSFGMVFFASILLKRIRPSI